MKGKSKKHAVSLIVLVVTILVLSIIAAAVIISLSNANIMGQASKVVFKQDMANYKETYEMYVIGKFADDANYDRSALNVTYASDSDTFQKIFGENVPDKYKVGLKIVKGKLVYETEDSTEKAVLEGLGILYETEKISVSLNGYAAGEWTNENVNITLTYSDLQGGKYQYKTTNQDWTDCDEAITITEDQEETYYFRAISTSGSVLYETNGYEIKKDTVAPTFNLTAVGNYGMGIDWSISDVTDDRSGVDNTGKITVSYGDTTSNINYVESSSIYGLSEYRQYTIKIEITDRAGNIGVRTTTATALCFVAGTKVLTEDGLKNIEDIVIGDKVYTINLDTNAKELKEVTELHKGYSYEICEITVEGNIIGATPTHPFYKVDKGWTSACDLLVGDMLVTGSYDSKVLSSIDFKTYDEPVPVYNFEVDINHNYLITELELLVHNAPCSS